MKAYYGSKFSENMTRTPEGFLVRYAKMCLLLGLDGMNTQEKSLE